MSGATGGGAPLLSCAREEGSSLALETKSGEASSHRYIATSVRQKSSSFRLWITLDEQAKVACRTIYRARALPAAATASRRVHIAYPTWHRRQLAPPAVPSRWD